MSQFSSIHLLIDELNLASKSFRWSGGAGKDLIALLRALRDPTTSLIDRLAKSFDDWIRLTVTDQNAVTALVGYSTGGAILYRWLITMATSDILARVPLVVAIAAPHTLPPRITLESHPDRPLVVAGEPTILPRELVPRTKDTSTQLRVVAGDNDLTIPLEFAVVPDTLGPDLAKTTIVRHATHGSICHHPQTLAHLRDWLQVQYPE